jgi:hypothetical protein
MTAWKRLALMGVMVCLPIPMLAASGLAVPLPSVVYRVAVGVAERTQAVAVRVPGFEAVVAETKHVARRGTIRLSAEEIAAAAPRRAVASASETRPQRTRLTPRPARRSVHRTVATRGRVARPRRSARPVAPTETDSEHGRTVAAPAESRDAPNAPQPEVREERESMKKDPVAVEDPGAASRPASETKPARPRDEPRTTPTREEPRNTPATGSAPPPPPPASPPASLPPLPVSPPTDPLPDPLPLTPKAQLEAIAAELREIAGNHDDDGGRVGQAVEKVESAVERLEKSPPDKQGAVGDIKNAVQKIDAALGEGEIDSVQRTLFVTRLNAVSAQLKAAP